MRGTPCSRWECLPACPGGVRDEKLRISPDAGAFPGTRPRASTPSLELGALQPPWEPRKTFREWGRVCVWGGWGEFLNLKTPHSDLGNQTLGAQRDSPVELICLASWVWGP